MLFDESGYGPAAPVWYQEIRLVSGPLSGEGFVQFRQGLCPIEERIQFDLDSELQKVGSFLAPVQNPGRMADALAQSFNGLGSGLDVKSFLLSAGSRCPPESFFWFPRADTLEEAWRACLLPCEMFDYGV